MSEQSILLQIRETAKNCPDELTREVLKDCADALAGWLKVLAEKPSTEAMKMVNAEWALAVRLMGIAKTAGDDNSQGGAMPVPEQQKMAA